MSLTCSKKRLTLEEVSKILSMKESWDVDMKAKEIKPAKLSRTLSAFANTSGGEIYLGITHESEDKEKYLWDGFFAEEETNCFITMIDEVFKSFEDINMEEFIHPLRGDFVLHITVFKAKSIIYSSDRKAYRRVGVQNNPCDTLEKMHELEKDKGLCSFEDENTTLTFEELKDSLVLNNFISHVCPHQSAYDWLRKQHIMDLATKISVAGVLLYDECPQAVLPKRSGIRILRFHTDETSGTRENMEDGYPISIEGDICSLIEKTVETVKNIVEKVGIIDKNGQKIKKYPDVTLHEIIANAVIHRDYSISNDIQIRIFTNRIEIESPGKLPGHITINNILNEQFPRNPKIIRLLTKFPIPPNKDVGEGLNSAFNAMKQMRLGPPVIEETRSSVLVTLKHERLADAETMVLDYLNINSTISNSIARELTGISDANKMKSVFVALNSKGLLEKVPGTRGNATLWRKSGLRESVGSFLHQLEFKF